MMHHAVTLVHTLVLPKVLSICLLMLVFGSTAAGLINDDVNAKHAVCDDSWKGARGAPCSVSKSLKVDFSKLKEIHDELSGKFKADRELSECYSGGEAIWYQAEYISAACGMLGYGGFAFDADEWEGTVLGDFAREVCSEEISCVPSDYGLTCECGEIELDASLFALAAPASPGVVKRMSTMNPPDLALVREDSERVRANETNNGRSNSTRRMYARKDPCVDPGSCDTHGADRSQRIRRYLNHSAQDIMGVDDSTALRVPLDERELITFMQRKFYLYTTNYLSFTSEVTGELIAFPGYSWGQGWTFATQNAWNTTLSFQTPLGTVTGQVNIGVPLTATIDIRALLSEWACGNRRGDIVAISVSGWRKWYRVNKITVNSGVRIDYTPPTCNL